MADLLFTEEAAMLRSSKYPDQIGPDKILLNYLKACK